MSPLFNVVHSHTARLMRDEQENGEGRGNVLFRVAETATYRTLGDGEKRDLRPSPYSRRTEFRNFSTACFARPGACSKTRPATKT